MLVQEEDDKKRGYIGDVCLFILIYSHYVIYKIIS